MNSKYILTSDGKLHYVDDELYHYGVVGMKWGVRRGNAQKAYEKASKKLDRLTGKVDKAESKARQKYAKLNRKSASIFATSKSVSRAEFKASKSQSRANVKMQKALKWYSKMEKTFADTPVKMNKDQADLGKKYMDLLNERAERRMKIHY